MTKIAWLHLSDWHQKDEEFDRKVVRDKLLDDLRSRSQLHPDLEDLTFVIFSGDLAFSGKKDEYTKAQNTFLDPILLTLGLSPSSFFFVPGNHDIDRDDVFSYAPAALQKPLTAEKDVQTWLTRDKARAKVLEPFEAYTSFVRDYTADPQYQAFSSIRIIQHGATSIGLLGLNSAWMCGRNKNWDNEVDDARHLIVGEPQIHDALRKIVDCNLRLVVMHHPFEWLASFDRERTETPLHQKVDFILHGHEHQPGVLAARNQSGNFTVVFGGACYDRRAPTKQRYANGYNFVLFDPVSRASTVYMRRWNDQRSEWEADTATGSVFVQPPSQPTIRRPRPTADSIKPSSPPAPIDKSVDDIEKKTLIRGDMIDGLLDSTFKLRTDHRDYTSIIHEHIDSQRIMPLELFYSTDLGALNWLNLCSDPSYTVYHDSLHFVEKNRGAILESCGHDFLKADPDFISLGPGDGYKDKHLLDALLTFIPKKDPLFYYPIDVSPILLCRTAQKLIAESEFKEYLRIKAVCSEFSHLRKLRPVFDFRAEPNLYVFLGNTLGNMPNEGEFLNTLHSTMTSDDYAIIEVRLKMDKMDGPGGSPDKRKRFNFSPLEIIGVKYEPEKLTFRKAHFLSSISGTETLVGDYRNYRYLDRNHNSRNVESTTLTYIHHYDDNSVKLVLTETGFQVKAECQSTNTILYVISRSPAPINTINAE